MTSDTCWTMIADAAHGDVRARNDFAVRYLGVVHTYLESRWRGTPLSVDVDDAAQEVFVRCYRTGGVLEKAEPGRPGGFQAFLYGVVRNVARELEAALRRSPPAPLEPVVLDDLAAPEDSLAVVFERTWAQTIMRQAQRLMTARASASGAAARRRVELLRLRFEEDQPIRAIAQLWGEDPARLHHEFARAREEFHRSLRDAVAFHGADSGAAVEAECRRLLAMLA
jgi:RNA polymerase sigma factor (sigma-70 family)